MTPGREIKLSELAKNIPGLSLQGNGEVKVRGIARDSRKVAAGDIFVAVPGTNADGARFIPDAVKAGACAVLMSGRTLDLSIPALVADDVRLAMGVIAARLYGRPDLGMEIIGITGTNGKTTISYILESILSAAGRKTGVIGTINYRYGETMRPAPTTTPESVDIFEILAEMKMQGVTHLVMEVSSHALDQKRVSGLEMGSAVFTNLTRDHLDYHRDLEEYFQAKKKLFTEVIRGRWAEPGPGPARQPIAVVNLDDEFGRRLESETRDCGLMVMGCSVKSDRAEVLAKSLELSAAGLRFKITAPGTEMKIESGLVGAHNVENILAAAAVCIALGVEPSAIEAGIKKLERVPGRLEPVENNAGITVLVDYAHTPDALDHAVGACRALAKKRLLTVFGCGGDRDPGKRPEMGRIAVVGSDIGVITSDNPRTEDPQKIIEQILAGVGRTGAAMIDAKALENGGPVPPGYLVEPDRARAIRLAVRMARPGDIVLIAGKGHEDYQILGANKIHFDDREEACAALKEREDK